MLVLIVDSSVQIIQRLGELVSETKNNSIIYKATCSKEAYRLLKEVKPQVVLLDSALPQGEAIDLLRKIKKSGSRATVIVLSNRVDDDTENEFKLNGADFFFDKYNEFEKIPELINSLAKNK